MLYNASIFVVYFIITSHKLAQLGAECRRAFDIVVQGMQLLIERRIGRDIV